MDLGQDFAGIGSDTGFSGKIDNFGQDPGD